MKIFFRIIISLFLIGLMTVNGFGFDLPVKRVGGIDYYYYTVQRNESLGDIIKKFGVGREDIIRNNPSAADGVSKGMVLYFPVSEFPENNMSLPGQSSTNPGEQVVTRYKVEKGETLYGVARRFNVSPDAIIALNPQAGSGIKHGQILLIPMVGEKVNEINFYPDLPINPVPGVIQEDTVTYVETPEVVENVSVEETALEVVTDTAHITLMLPLMIGSQEENRQALMSSDFIRGFMLGIKSLSVDYTYPCVVNVFDTKGEASEVQKILSDPTVEASDIVISHEEGVARQFIPEFALNHESYVLNLFASHDTTYMENPFMMQANIPAKNMYEKASQAIFAAYPDYKPVFLIAKGGRGEKMPFISYMQERFDEYNIEPINLTFDGMLTSNDIESLDFNEKYLFIPVSGALSEFNKFSLTLTSLRDNSADPSSIALFGYPDWTTFRGESLESLHRLGAMIYSRFYCDENNNETIQFNKIFEQTYGVKPLEQVPSQSLLGYDSARYILSNLKNNEGIFSPEESMPFRGIQSTFMFEHPDENIEIESGYVNSALYIITYLPDGRVSVKVL